MAAAIETPTAPMGLEKDPVVTQDASKRTVSNTLLNHSRDADAAMQAFADLHGQVIDLSPEKSKALLRKIDMHLMPVRHAFYIYMSRLR